MENENKPTTYTPAVKKAVMKYRAKNLAKYNDFQRQYYHDKKTDAEWYDKFCERCREANRRYREKKRLERCDEVKPKGRPRKEISPIIIEV